MFRAISLFPYYALDTVWVCILQLSYSIFECAIKGARLQISQLHLIMTDIAPALSTAQDDITFARVGKVTHERTHLGLSSSAPEAEIKNAIIAYYSLHELSEYLLSNKYRRVTLQFPDSLISDSAKVVLELQRIYKSKSDSTEKAEIWILADTSYSPCCIDEVAAEHVHSDLVIHFGDACLNAVEKLPALYVFGKPVLDLSEIASKFRTRYEKDDKVVLMADAPNTRYLEELQGMLLDYPNVKHSDLHSEDVQSIGYHPILRGQNILNRTIQDIQDESELKKYELFYLTKPQPPKLLQLTTKFNSVTLYEDSKISTGPFPNLMRRYRYMTVARTAGTIGILVNTLSLAHTKTLINSLSRQIKEAGKKHYVFVVGKPNVAKLANFEQIDVWCILGCDNQGIIVDEHGDYFKPIITPYELLLALSDDLTWTGEWKTNFANLLEEKEVIEREEKSNESDEEPEFDPVTGRFMLTSRPLRQLNHLRVTQTEEAEEENSLVKRFSNQVSIKGTVSTAATHLQGRHWTGLGSDYVENNDEGAELEEGRGGVARGYDFDVNNDI